MKRKGKILAFTSGKGGVGKSNTCANLGILLAKQGYRTCIIDADFGLANVNVLLGLSCEQTIKHVVNGECKLNQAIIRGPEGVDILSADSGAHDSPLSDPKHWDFMASMLVQLRPVYDFILIDTAAGLDQRVRNFLQLADEVILVITPEPTSLTDAFGLVKLMKNQFSHFQVIANRVSNVAKANQVFLRFNQAVKKYIDVKTSLIGYVTEDPHMQFSVLRRKALVQHKPNCPASRCLFRIAHKLSHHVSQERMLDARPTQPSVDEEAEELKRTLSKKKTESSSLSQELNWDEAQALTESRQAPRRRTRPPPPTPQLEQKLQPDEILSDATYKGKHQWLHEAFMALYSESLTEPQLQERLMKLLEYLQSFLQSASPVKSKIKTYLQSTHHLEAAEMEFEKSKNYIDEFPSGFSQPQAEIIPEDDSLQFDLVPKPQLQKSFYDSDDESIYMYHSAEDLTEESRIDEGHIDDSRSDEETLDMYEENQVPAVEQMKDAPEAKIETENESRKINSRRSEDTTPVISENENLPEENISSTSARITDELSGAEGLSYAMKLIQRLEKKAQSNN